jgi:hypothetical protein
MELNLAFYIGLAIIIYVTTIGYMKYYNDFGLLYFLLIFSVSFAYIKLYENYTK